MNKKKPSLIVFCGVDGAGKTTLAKELIKYLKKQGLKPGFIHGHGYGVSQNSFGLDEMRVKSLRSLFRLLVPFAFFDNLFTYYFKYKPILSNKTLVCDRYFYDKLARMMHYGICSQFIAKIYLKLLPKPNFVFFLDIDPKKALRRKKEYSSKELFVFKKIYQFLAKNLKASIINTNLPLDTCIQKIIEHVETQR